MYIMVEMMSNWYSIYEILREYEGGDGHSRYDIKNIAEIKRGNFYFLSETGYVYLEDAKKMSVPLKRAIELIFSDNMSFIKQDN